MFFFQTVEDDAQDSSFSFFGYCGNYLKTEWEKLYGQISTTLKKDKTSDQSGGSRSRRASSHLSSSNQMLPFYQKLVAYPHLTEKFNKTNISWGVLDKSLHRSEKEIDLIITAAFQIWSEVTPLTFHKDHKHPDIIIRFGTGELIGKGTVCTVIKKSSPYVLSTVINQLKLLICSHFQFLVKSPTQKEHFCYFHSFGQVFEKFC